MNKLKQTNLAKVLSPPARVYYLGLVLVVFLILFTTCKKYDEGGFVKLTDKHLFGKKEQRHSKTWKLKKYEVNGIDSTYLIPGTNNIPDYYDKFITMEYYRSDPSTEFFAHCYFYHYSGTIGRAYKDILILPTREFNKEDSIQCYQINGNTVCVRNILIPELPVSRNYSWNIKKLTKKEFIISVELKNSYKIILTQ